MSKRQVLNVKEPVAKVLQCNKKIARE